MIYYVVMQSDKTVSQTNARTDRQTATITGQEAPRILQLCLEESDY